MQYVVDTHILLWRLLEPDRLSQKVRRLFATETNRFYIPTICVLEAQYLIEIGRIALDVQQLLDIVAAEPAYHFLPYDETAMLQSLRLTGTRDPFDRVILAHALASHRKIITKDRWMTETVPQLAVF